MSRRARVRLDPVTLADGTDFLHAVAASRRLHGRWVSPAATPALYAAMVQRLNLPPNRGWLVRRTEGGALVGCVEVTQIVMGALCSAYLGYFAFTGHERQGLMQEALRLVARIAFREMGLHRLEANIQPANAASIALVRSCGFRQEGYSPRYLKLRGRWRDHERWALLAD